MAITGTISECVKLRGFDDASSLWEVKLGDESEPFTCRTFDAERSPVIGDTVLVFLMAERNHASRVVFDADLRITTKALS